MAGVYGLAHPSRARGWALAPGLTYLANAEGDPAPEALGRATIAAVHEELDEIGGDG